MSRPKQYTIIIEHGEPEFNKQKLQQEVLNSISKALNALGKEYSEYNFTHEWINDNETL